MYILDIICNKGKTMPITTFNDENIDISTEATQDEISQELLVENIQAEEAHDIEHTNTPQKEAEMMAAYSETGELPSEVEPTEIGEPSERVAGISALSAKGAKALTKWLKGKAGKYGKAITSDVKTTIEALPTDKPEVLVKIEYDPVLKAKRDARADLLAEQVQNAKDYDYDVDLPHQSNFNNFSSDEIADTIAMFSERNKGKIQIQRRGVQTKEEAFALAENLNSDPIFLHKVLGLKPGETLNSESILALGNTVEVMTMDVMDMANKFDTLDEAGIAKFMKAYKMTNLLSQKLKGVRAEAGRALNVFNWTAEFSEANIVMRETIKDEFGLTPDVIARMLTMAKTPRQTEEVLKAVNLTGIEKLKGNLGTAYDTVYETFINGILSGVSTHIVNGIGSFVRVGVNVGDTALASMFGRDIKLGEANAQFVGIMTGWSEAFEVMMRGIKTAERYGATDSIGATKYERVIRPETYGVEPTSAFGKSIDLVGAVINTPTERVMQGMDGFNKKMGERSVLAGLAYRQAYGMNLPEDQAMLAFQELFRNPTIEMKLKAEEAGKIMTFQEELGVFGKKGQEFFQGNPVGRAIVPFFKTPWNLVKQAYGERTPLAIFTKKYQDAIKAGGAEAQMAKSKLASGTFLMGSVMALTSAGKITGSYSTDPDVRRAQMNAGWKPKSFVIENKDGSKTYIPYDRVDPFSFLVGASADIAQLLKEKEYQPYDNTDESYEKRLISSMVLAFSENTLDKTFLRGVNDMMDALTSGSPYKINRIVQNYSNAIIPFSGMRRNIANTIDTTVTQTNEVSDYVMENLTVWGKHNAPLIDIFGRTVKNPAIHMYFPFGAPYKKAGVTKVDQEILKLAEGTRRAPINRVRDTIQGVKLTKFEISDITRYSRGELEMDGRNFFQTVKELMATDGYKRAAPDERIDTLRSIANNFDEVAKMWYVDEHPELLQKIKLHSLGGMAKNLAYQNGTTIEEEENNLMEKLKSF